MTGRILAALIVVAALVAGVSLWYLQVYAYYEEVTANGQSDVQLTGADSGRPETILYENFEAIDSDSSPIRYRACFSTQTPLATLRKKYVTLQKAEPRVAPYWFDCFDAEDIGEALSRGQAQAFLGVKDIRYGIDRVVAVFPDGRGYVWHEINRCGEIVFDGQPAPEDCPPPPEGY